MSLIINTNISSLNAQRQLVQSNMELDKASERLSSGKRINSAADDAAGLVISNRMTAQVRGLEQAKRNALDGISLIQVAEGALDESTNILQRIRELAIQSSNGIYSNTDRATLDAEVQQLVSELDRISETTQFNGRKVLDGSLGSVDLQVGSEAQQNISFSIEAMSADSLGLGSTNSDFVGTTMDLSTNGTFSSALAYSAVKVNGQSVGSLTTDSTVEDLLTQIGENVDGVSARVLTTVTAPSTGTGVLTGSEALNISAIGLDGTSQSFSIGNTTSMEDLVDKINEKTGSLMTASLDDSGALMVTSEKFARITLQDTTQGTATGINDTQIADPDIAELIDGLNSSWLSEAEQRIQTYYGITGDGVDLTLDLTTLATPGGALAAVSYTGAGNDMQLQVDMTDFTATGDPSGGSPWLYMDRIIVHEMTHAVMVRNIDMTNLTGWFIEGTAELIHGADERVQSDLGSLTNQTDLSNAFATGKGLGSNPSALGYSAAYTAVKMMHDDILAAGGTGIIEIFDELKDGVTTLDQAITTVAGNHVGLAWSDLTTFEADFDTTGYAYMSTLTLGDTDTGAIGAGDYGGTAVTAESVMPNNNTGPITSFNLILPDEYSGGLATSSAQLILESDDGDQIVISKGAQGTDSDLSLLGLQIIEEGNVVIGQTVSATNQNAALNANDLTINGVAIASVDANAGLMAKIDAINDVTDETGVVASIIAQESYSFNTDTTIEYTSNGALSIANAGVLGLNGIGFTVNLNDTAYDIAAAINNLTEYHGVSAYVDDSAQLHIFSDSTITFGDSVGGNLVNEIDPGLVGPAGVGSVVFNGIDISLTDITDLDTTLTELNTASGQTGVVASIDDNGELQLTSSSAIKIQLGDVNGMQTLYALGISFGVNGDEDLTDTDADNLLGDEVLTLGARIKLDSIYDNTISIDVTEDGATATGLSDLNSDESGLTGSSLSNISVATVSEAQDAISAVDNALESINDTRAQLGAVNNRLEFTISNLMNVAEKTSAARSRIVDADYAKETTNLTRAQVLQQASQTMLAQANAQPQRVLQLLN